jgi:hypothetical protein
MGVLTGCLEILAIAQGFSDHAVIVRKQYLIFKSSVGMFDERYGHEFGERSIY